MSNYTPNYQWPPADTTKIFRGHLRSLPDQPYPPNAFQSWTQSFFIPRLPLPYGEQVTDLAPGQRPPEQVQLHSWTASYNLNLIGKDRLPTGVQPGEAVYDLTPSQRTPEQIQLHSWTWAYNLNLIGKDRMIAGKQIYDLTVSQRFPEQVKSWSLDLSTTTLFPVTPTGPLGIVANQYSWPLPQPGAALQLVQQPYSLALLAGPPPDLTKIFRPHQRSLPDQPAPPLLQQSAFQAFAALHPTVVVQLPHNQYDWLVPKAPQQPAPSYTASYNQNLIGQDKLLPGRQITDLAPSDFQRLFQTWIQMVSLALTVPPVFVPARPMFLGPPFATEPDWRRSWEAHYNLNLVGQDKLPVGDRVYDLTPPDYQRALQTWIQSVNLALITTRPALTTTFNQYDWPVPKGPQQPAPSWTASYNLNLIGKDKLPVGARFTELPQRDFARIFQTWISQTGLALTEEKPFAQYDWPVPKGAQQPALGWAWAYNLSLIGKDALPRNQKDWPYPALHTLPTLLQSWLFSRAALLPTPQIPPGRAFFDRPQLRVDVPADLYFIGEHYIIIPPFVPPVGASYRLLSSHYLYGYYYTPNTIITEGKEIPFGWVPTLAVDPLNTLAVTAYYRAGPRQTSYDALNTYDTMYRRDYGDIPVNSPVTHWQQIPGTSMYQLTGLGVGKPPFGGN